MPAARGLPGPRRLLLSGAELRTARKAGAPYTVMSIITVHVRSSSTPQTYRSISWAFSSCQHLVKPKSSLVRNVLNQHSTSVFTFLMKTPNYGSFRPHKTWVCPRVYGRGP